MAPFLTDLSGLVRLCEGVPLIAGHSAALLCDREDLSLGELVARMEECGQIAFLEEAAETATRPAAVFDAFYRELSKDAAKLYRALGTHPTRDLELVGADPEGLALAGAQVGALGGVHGGQAGAGAEAEDRFRPQNLVGGKIPLGDGYDVGGPGEAVVELGVGADKDSCSGRVHGGGDPLYGEHPPRSG